MRGKRAEKFNPHGLKGGGEQLSGKIDEGRKTVDIRGSKKSTDLRDYEHGIS